MAPQDEQPADESPVARMLSDALKLYRAGQFKEAQELCLRILEHDPQHFDALQIAGGLALQNGDAPAALDLLTRAIGINPNHAASRYNRGNALMALERYAEAVAGYDAALRIKPRYASAHNNRGAALRKMGQFAPAAQSFEAAFTLRPDDADAYNNHGLTLMDMGRSADALKSFDAAIAIRPDFASAYGNRGNALLNAKQFSAALESYDRALTLDPSLDLFHGARLHAQMCVCNWRHFESRIADIRRLIDAGKSPSAPFPILAALDSPALQRSVTTRYVQRLYPARDDLGPVPKFRRPGKIRVGYFSGDFHDHPVPRLTAEMFERHDRDAFEIFAFSFGPDIRDGMRLRLERAFDRFIDVREKSDLEIAALSRDLRIDIAVDLSGHTTDGRPGIFAFRAAPVQASYIGYLGTMAAAFYDYLIADPVLIPATSQQHYAEKIVYLPSYQANDSARAISERVFTREELGLPAEGFVFCCFNNSYKITPAVFESWMRILGRVDGSSLLLFAANKTVKVNLTAEAVKHGIDPRRIVFCAALPAPEYMSRLRTADLFLDTLPYNAGTTASDALWAGLPVLTRMGESFPARIAASLLRALDLPELITETEDRYETQAVEFARRPAELNRIKQKLQDVQHSCILFDAAAFTLGLEMAYTEMQTRWAAHLGPAHIYIKI